MTAVLIGAQARPESVAIGAAQDGGAIIKGFVGIIRNPNVNTGIQRLREPASIIILGTAMIGLAHMLNRKRRRG